MAKEALGGGRAVGATDVVVVYGGECRELAVAQAMATMVVEGQLAITARHPGTAALETIGTVTGHLFQVRAFGARQGVERMVALADAAGDLSFAKFAENHRFQIPEGAHWNDVRQKAKNIGLAIQTALRQLEAANPDLLAGIFGDSPWTNRERLPDETLKNLIEHFSTQILSVTNVPEDELGNAYEFLIKKFADDSGHTAAELYTNRTVVHLMTQLLAPQAGESIYDPTCGTGGMLISALVEVQRSGGEYRTLKLYGQERNLITSGIARMNLFLHGVEDFQIIRGDTLADPRHTAGNGLRQFDVVLANPPYSIKQWHRTAWGTDKWGRNFLGTPPQGRADYAFQQHILASLSDKGRCAVLWPHGVLFRNEEQGMRTRMVEQDWVEAVIGLGPNLFYNSPMEACVVVCNRRKPAARMGKVLFIDALHSVTRERALSFLKPRKSATHPAGVRRLCRCGGLCQGSERHGNHRQCRQSLDSAVREESSDSNRR